MATAAAVIEISAILNLSFYICLFENLQLLFCFEFVPIRWTLWTSNTVRLLLNDHWPRWLLYGFFFFFRDFKLWPVFFFFSFFFLNPSQSLI